MVVCDIVVLLFVTERYCPFFFRKVTGYDVMTPKCTTTIIGQKEKKPFSFLHRIVAMQNTLLEDLKSYVCKYLITQ